METLYRASAAQAVQPLRVAPPQIHQYGSLHPSRDWLQPEMPLGTAQVASALRLTETEARLALTLTQGKTIKDFARAQGCTWHTARTHARNLLAKTGCHRQAEVVRLVHGLF